MAKPKKQQLQDKNSSDTEISDNEMNITYTESDDYDEFNENANLEKPRTDFSALHVKCRE